MTARWILVKSRETPGFEARLLVVGSRVATQNAGMCEFGERWIDVASRLERNGFTWSIDES